MTLPAPSEVAPPGRRLCCCRPGQPPWAARADDRFCALCGRELLAVLPLAPVLAAGPPVALAAYLKAAAPAGDTPYRELTGRLALQLVGAGAALPRVQARPLAEPAPRLRSARLAGFATLRLDL